MICVVDYGVGNVQAFLNLFKRIGIDAMRASKSDELVNANKLILPGVGHFDHAMEQLNLSGMREKLDDLVLGSKVPIMGICVGMQMLADSSDEGSLPGLNWIPGRVREFSSEINGTNMPMPHMGWNELNTYPQEKLFAKGFESSAHFYFLHSYFFDALDKRDVAATATYGFEFDAVVSRGNIFGVQFHPEKSHSWGEKLLRNFAEI